MAVAGQIAALGTAACWASSATLFTTAGRRMGAIVLNRLRLAVALVLLGATLLVTRGNPWPVWATAPQIGWLALSGLIGFVFGDSFSFKSMVILGAGPATLLASLAPIFTAFLAWPILQETLGPPAILGIALTVGGLVWVLMARRGDRPEHPSGSVALGVFAGVMGGLGQAGGFVISKLALRDGLDALSATMIRVAAGTLTMWILAAVRGEIPRTVAALKDRVGALTMAGGAFMGPFLGVTLSLLALKLSKAGIAASIIACYPVITILLSSYFHRERITFRMISGALIVVAGVVVLFWK